MGLWIGPTGTILNLPFTGSSTTKSATDVESASFARLLTPSLLALCFANCKNVKHVDVTGEVGPSPKWLRRQKAPLLRYHVLEIGPMKEVLRTEGGIESNGLKKALHICRGHFATYSEERPLFGKIAGTVWKPMHVRGNEKHGIVDKDYSIRTTAK